MPNDNPSVFEWVDQAVDFRYVQDCTHRGDAALGLQVPVEYELPREAVTETIVNAVTQR